MKKLLITISTCSVLWLAGCATHTSHEGGSVARTLDSYQVGTTTFADFKHDSHLHEGTTVMNGVRTQPAPQQNEAREVYTYHFPRSSHWRIFKSEDQTKVGNGGVISHNRELTVGTPSGPLYILTFNTAGVLIDKKPVS